MPRHSPLPKRAPAETRVRLLNAGLRLFAEHGFRGVSVRDLCTAAEANVAAVNYHFGGKEGLYNAIFEAFLDDDELRHQSTLGRMSALSAQSRDGEAIEVFVRDLVEMFSGDERSRWLGVLVIREFTFPSAAFDLIYQRRIAPTQSLIAAMVARSAGVSAEAEPVRIQVHALLGMVMSLGISRSVLWRQLAWEQGYTPETVERTVSAVSGLIRQALGLQQNG